MMFLQFKTAYQKANIKGIPVITATQMLLSMTQNERATRLKFQMLQILFRWN